MSCSIHTAYNNNNNNNTKYIPRSPSICVLGCVCFLLTPGEAIDRYCPNDIFALKISVSDACSNILLIFLVSHKELITSLLRLFSACAYIFCLIVANFISSDLIHGPPMGNGNLRPNSDFRGVSDMRHMRYSNRIRIPYSSHISFRSRFAVSWGV